MTTPAPGSARPSGFATREPDTIGAAYWRCRTREHLWLDRYDAEHCCDPGWSRAMISRGEAVGVRWSKSAVDGFVFVWLPTGRAL